VKATLTTAKHLALTALAIALWAGRQVSVAEIAATAAPGTNPLAAATTSASATLNAGPIEIGSRKQLFVDDRWIARCQGITSP